MTKGVTDTGGGQELRKINALLRFYFKLDPEKLTDDEFATHWNDLKFALEFEAGRWEMKQFAKNG